MFHANPSIHWSQALFARDLFFPIVPFTKAWCYHLRQLLAAVAAPVALLVSTLVGLLGKRSVEMCSSQFTCVCDMFKSSSHPQMYLDTSCLMCFCLKTDTCTRYLQFYPLPPSSSSQDVLGDAGVVAAGPSGAAAIGAAAPALMFCCRSA